VLVSINSRKSSSKSKKYVLTTSTIEREFASKVTYSKVANASPNMDKS
jgi:hypothetical protein